MNEEGKAAHRLSDIHFDPANAKAEYLCHGRLEILQHFAQMCMFLSEQLLDHGEKFRVTIECDPELQDFVMKREQIN